MPARKRFHAQITIPLPLEIKDKLEETAYARGIPTAQICREAINQYLFKFKSEDKHDESNVAVQPAT